LYASRTAEETAEPWRVTYWQPSLEPVQHGVPLALAWTYFDDVMHVVRGRAAGYE